MTARWGMLVGVATPKNEISEIRFILRDGTTKLCTWLEAYRGTNRPARGKLVKIPQSIQADAALEKFRGVARVASVASVGGAGRVLYPQYPRRLVVFLDALRSR